MERLSSVKEEVDDEHVSKDTLALVKVSSPECIQVRFRKHFG
jgi:hypothetical protein